MRRMARPSSTIDRPARTPASASVLTRATLEANVVATTIPVAFSTSFSISGASSASDRPGCGDKTFVESQISARTPSFEISAQRSGSNGSPTPGVGSSLKSPECSTRPPGVSITRPELSGTECEIGTKPTVNGPTLTVSGQALTV